MDLFEKLFYKISQSETFKKKQGPGYLSLRDISKHVDFFSNSMVCGPTAVHPMGSRGFVGIYGTQLFLPEKIDFFIDKAHNHQLYQYLILQAMASYRLGLFGPEELESPIVQRLEFLEHAGTFNNHLDELFPGYFEFQSNLLQNVRDRAKPRAGPQTRIFEYWQKQVLTRGQQQQPKELIDRAYKRNEPVPSFLFLTVPSLARRKNQVSNHVGDVNAPPPPNNNIEYEIEKTYSGPNQGVDLEKEKANQITHSFEKLETADEYQGGRRIDSGENELKDHATALNELNLNKITRGGEAAQSAYRAESFIDFAASEHGLKKTPKLTEFFYPEWSMKHKHYIRDYCRLVESPLEMAIGANDFRQILLSKYRHQIKHWQSRIQNLFAEPLWQKRKSEGDEIDLDEVIRDYAAIISRKSVAGRWYMNWKKQFNDLEIVILFDQSHSSDSWVCNNRILDITLEAVGLTGLLFDQIFEAVTVAGVWSATRHDCAFQVYKGRDDPWSQFFKRASNIQARDYTRLGPAIRHATNLLKKSTHPKKLILLLTDGKPTDIDGYEGLVGVTDVAQACREAEVCGIMHYALIVDHKQKAHFTKMFKRRLLLHDPKALPEEMFKILMKRLCS